MRSSRLTVLLLLQLLVSQQSRPLPLSAPASTLDSGTPSIPFPFPPLLTGRSSRFYASTSAPLQPNVHPRTLVAPKTQLVNVGRSSDDPSLPLLLSGTPAAPTYLSQSTLDNPSWSGFPSPSQPFRLRSSALPSLTLLEVRPSATSTSTVRPSRRAPRLESSLRLGSVSASTSPSLGPFRPMSESAKSPCPLSARMFREMSTRCW